MATGGPYWRTIRESTRLWSRSTARFTRTKKGTQDQDDALEHGDVALEDGQVQEVAGAWPGEHRLDEDRAAELKAELQPEHGEDLGRRVLHHVREDGSPPQPLGREGEDEILGQDVERGRSDDPRDDAQRDEGQSHRGQHEVAQVLDEPSLPRPPHGGQPVELDREDDDENDPRPVVRDGHADDGQRARQLVGEPALAEGGEQPQPDAKAEGDDRRRQSQDEAVAKGVAHVVDHRRAAWRPSARGRPWPRGRARECTARAAAGRSPTPSWPPRCRPSRRRPASWRRWDLPAPGAPWRRR